MNKNPLKSKTLWGIASMLAGYAAPVVMSKLGVPADQQADVVQAVLTVGGAALGIYGRYKANR